MQMKEKTILGGCEFPSLFQEMNYANLRCRMFRRSPVGSKEVEQTHDIHGILI